MSTTARTGHIAKTAFCLFLTLPILGQYAWANDISKTPTCRERDEALLSWGNALHKFTTEYQSLLADERRNPSRVAAYSARVSANLKALDATETRYYEADSRCNAIPVQDATKLLPACGSNGDPAECQWEKQCMASDHPAWEKDAQTISSNCERDYRAFGQELQSYPEQSFHYDTQSWRHSASEAADPGDGRAEKLLRAQCGVRSPAVLAKGLYGCAEYSIESREATRQGNQMQLETIKSIVKKAGNRMRDSTSTFIDAVPPADTSSTPIRGTP